MYVYKIIFFFNLTTNFYFSIFILAVFATGNRDGKIMIWDTRANRSGESKPDNVIFNAHIKKTKKPSTVTALAFQSDENLISCSAGDG